MPAEMRRIAVLSLEPDPGNAGVGMRFDSAILSYAHALRVCDFFIARRHFPLTAFIKAHI
jgi:hypothetical protein